MSSDFLGDVSQGFVQGQNIAWGMQDRMDGKEDRGLRNAISKQELESLKINQKIAIENANAAGLEAELRRVMLADSLEEQKILRPLNEATTKHNLGTASYNLKSAEHLFNTQKEQYATDKAEAAKQKESTRKADFATSIKPVVDSLAIMHASIQGGGPSNINSKAGTAVLNNLSRTINRNPDLVAEFFQTDDNSPPASVVMTPTAGDMVLMTWKDKRGKPYEQTISIDDLYYASHDFTGNLSHANNSLVEGALGHETGTREKLKNLGMVNAVTPTTQGIIANATNASAAKPKTAGFGALGGALRAATSDDGEPGANLAPNGLPSYYPQNTSPDKQPYDANWYTATQEVLGDLDKVRLFAGGDLTKGAGTQRQNIEANLKKKIDILTADKNFLRGLYKAKGPDGRPIISSPNIDQLDAEDHKTIVTALFNSMSNDSRFIDTHGMGNASLTPLEFEYLRAVGEGGTATGNFARPNYLDRASYAVGAPVGDALRRVLGEDPEIIKQQREIADARSEQAKKKAAKQQAYITGLASARTRIAGTPGLSDEQKAEQFRKEQISLRNQYGI
jgi:hypothetical protein